jgi:superoxide dismutase
MNQHPIEIAIQYAKEELAKQKERKQSCINGILEAQQMYIEMMYKTDRTEMEDKYMEMLQQRIETGYKNIDNIEKDIMEIQARIEGYTIVLVSIQSL